MGQIPKIEYFANFGEEFVWDIEKRVASGSSSGAGDPPLANLVCTIVRFTRVARVKMERRKKGWKDSEIVKVIKSGS